MSQVNFEVLRKYTQARELLIQGVTLKNTFKDMSEVWLELHDQNKRCIIVDQIATRMKYQAVTIYATRFIKYINSIVGLDLVPLSKQDPETRTWRMDAILRNIAGNKVESHEHLFTLLLVNLYGLSEDIVKFAFNPTWEGMRKYFMDTYDFDLGEDGLKDEDLTIEAVEVALTNFLANGTDGFKLY